MPVTGYTATGASSIYSTLGDAEKAYYYLDFLIKHKNISPTTMYAEGNPVIESPLSYATSVHDMLLQSWGGKVRVFPASPEKWQDVAFHQLRAQGAFLVSAKKDQGQTQFVEVKSEVGSKLLIDPNIESPYIYINGTKANASDVSIGEKGFYTVAIKKDERVLFSRKPLKQSTLQINAKPINSEQQNLFGYSEKTKRLPSDKFYSNKAK